MRDNSIKILIICLLILGVFLGAYEGLWKQGAKKVSNYDVQIAQVSDQTYLEVIWDASGSMWGRDTGVEKITRSKEVLKTFAAQLPDDIKMGLRIFGARRVGDLKDSFLAISLQEGNRDKIINFLSNVKPLGKSPIAYSLQQAAADLTAVDGQRYILLISDGIDNGTIPSAGVLAKLLEENIVLDVILLGDQADEVVKDGLEQMSKETGGKYYNFKDYQDLIPTFSEQ